MQPKFVFRLFSFFAVLFITSFANAQFKSLKEGENGKKGVGNDTAGKWKDVAYVSGNTYRQLGLRFSSPDTDLPNYPNVLPLFRKGTWEVPTMKNLRFNSMNLEQDGQDAGSETKLNLNLETHYFPWNKIGLGLEVQYDHTSSKNGSETVTSDFLTYGHVTYGFPIKPKWGIYIRGGVGIGSGKTEFTQGTNTQEIKSDIFSYKFEVGSPLYLNHNLYLNPNLSYKNTSWDFDNQEETESNFRVGIGLVSYINCGDEHDYADTLNPPMRRNRYAPGVSFIGMHARTSYSTGTSETILSNQTFKDDFSRLNLKFDYTYQVFQNFGAGVDIGFRRTMVKSDGGSFENTQTYFTVAPKIIYQIPTNNWSNDFFITVGGGIGSRKNETVISGNSNEQKDNISLFNAGVGYNWFLSRTSMFTFTVGPEWITEKDAENTDLKIKEDGINFEIGFRSSLPSFRYTRK